MLKQIALLILALASPAVTNAAPQGDCEGSPAHAVLDLPAPLSEWGTIVCTPYGHIIANREGWIWSRPGSFSPVFIPSQMVRSNPEPLGNASHFTEIEIVEVPVADKSANDALTALQDGLAPEPASKAYRLSATGSLGRNLVLYFFQLGTSTWGIWCDKDGANCGSSTAFMVLDMRKGS